MDSATLERSAALIARRNAGESVAQVVVGFDNGTLRLTFRTKSEPTDDDREDCELACAELIAEFPEIRTAETRCVPLDGCEREEGLALVLQRA